MTSLSPEERRARNREYNAAYRERHREAIRSRQREWAAAKAAEDPVAARAKYREWDAAHREQRTEAQKARYWADREKYLEKRRLERERDPEKARGRDRAWYAANAEAKRAEAREYRRQNPEKVREAYRRWEAANREVRYAINNRRRVRLRVSMDRIDRMLSAEYRKAIRRDPCYYCGATEGKFHADHYVPLAIGGTDHWWNLVRACARCNQCKSASHGDDFFAQLRSEADTAA